MARPFIDGDWVAGSGGITLPVVEPAMGRAYGEIAEGTSEDVDRAVRAASHAFDEGAWGRTTATERGRMLTRPADLVLSNAAHLALVEARDIGKPTRDGARQMRVGRLRVGQVCVDSYGACAGIELPFGGNGKSCHGREKGFAALHDVSRTKTMVLNHGV